MRPLYQKLQHRGFNGDGRSLARYSRASLQDSSLCVRRVKSYSIVVLTGTDALPPRRPVGTLGLSVRCRTILTTFHFNGDGRTDRASLQDSVTAIVESEGRTPSG